MLKSEKYQMVMVNSLYKVASDEVNRQIDEINDIMDEYDERAMLVGEGPLTADLITITDKDFKTVSVVSIGIIFIIILFLFSLPVPVPSDYFGGSNRICNLCQYGNPLLYGNDAALCGVYRNRNHTAWVHCRLRDSHDHKI